MVVIKSYAKLNLFLKVVGFRDDCYHNLESIFAQIDLHDKIVISKSPNFSLKISGEFSNLIDVNNNIFTQIFEYFARNFKLESAIKIDLEKNIPIGAGLGGGSSNGANFIKTLNDIFSLNLSKSALQDIAINFGSDLPFFFEEDLCLVRGRGEDVKKLSTIAPKLSQQFKSFLNFNKVILINPKIHLSTPLIFKNFLQQIIQNKLQYSKHINLKKLNDFLPIELLKNNHNDLENIAMIIAPELIDIKNNLQKFNPICAKMSGSGSSFFAIFNEENNFKNCLEFFSKNFPQYLTKEIKIRNKNFG